uniref:Uncharacterized protein n=1 Tax=Arundo donax TaxID=35708 RepID=A0A0A9A3S2_ARUDO
MDYVNLINQ